MPKHFFFLRRLTLRDLFYSIQSLTFQVFEGILETAQKDEEIKKKNERRSLAKKLFASSRLPPHLDSIDTIRANHSSGRGESVERKKRN